MGRRSTTTGPPSGPGPIWPATGPVVVEAWAPWCGSCRALAPVVERIAAQSGIPVVSLPVETEPASADRLGLRSVPTLVALRDGVELGRLVGLQPADAVESLFALAAGVGDRVNRRAPTSLVMARAGAGGILVIAAAALSSVALGLIGALGLGWAAFGLVRR